VEAVVEHGDDLAVDSQCTGVAVDGEQTPVVGGTVDGTIATVELGRRRQRNAALCIPANTQLHPCRDATIYDTTRHDTRSYLQARSEADISQLNLPHGTNNYKVDNGKTAK